MGDSSTCVVMPAFSYASPTPNEAKQGNPMHALGESISFGRYMTEPLAWEKWSTFSSASSNKSYVEEAKSYAQPGSVAQKKAFFEAHYKRIAARKAAAEAEAAAAAADAAAAAAAREAAGGGGDDCENTELCVENDDKRKSSESRIDNVAAEEEAAAVVTPVKKNVFDDESELSGTSQMEKPLLKKSSSNREVSSVCIKKKSSSPKKVPKIPSPPPPRANNTPRHVRKAKNATTPMITKKPPSTNSSKENKSPPKTLRTLLDSSCTKEPDKPPAASAKVCSTSTPLRTPLQATPSRVSKLPPVTPRTEDRRTNALMDPLGSKTTGPKWHILSAVSKSLTACRNKLQSPTLSTPFLLRTEERAARRKQKLEEKFNAKDKEEEKVQLQTKNLKEKAETELRKFRQSFCFKARPLPHFYKQKETTQVQTTNKAPAPHHEPPPKLGRKPSGSRLQHSSTSSLPHPPTLAMANTKKELSMNASKKVKKNGRAAMISHASKLNVSSGVAHENTSPNIQL